MPGKTVNHQERDQPRQHFDLERKFRRNIERLVGVDCKVGLIAAISGGADSTALLYLLHGLKEEFGWPLTVAHLDHGLRGMAGSRDREFVENLAGNLVLPFVYRETDCRAIAEKRKIPLEEAAREARYSFLEEARHQAGAEYIAVGHTADDNAESILYHVLRGTGPRGLAGIPSQRGAIIRPLLNTWRREIVQFLKERGLTWVEDQTNSDPGFTRNRIRTDLIPKLEKDYNPAVKDALTRMALVIRDEEEYWEDHITAVARDVGRRFEEDRIAMNAKALSRLHRAVARRLIRRAISDLQGTVLGLGLDHVETLLEMAAGLGPRAVDLPSGLRAWLDGDSLSISRRSAPIRAGFQYDLSVPGEAMIHESGVVVEASLTDHGLDPGQMGSGSEVLDLDRVVLPLMVRNVKPGDRFGPLGMSGEKKVSDFFIDRKVPAAKRPFIPLVLDREGIIWVGGHGLADRVKITPRSSRRLLLRIRTGIRD